MLHEIFDIWDCGFYHVDGPTEDGFFRVSATNSAAYFWFSPEEKLIAFNLFCNLPESSRDKIFKLVKELGYKNIKKEGRMSNKRWRKEVKR